MTAARSLQVAAVLVFALARAPSATGQLPAVQRSGRLEASSTPEVSSKQEHAFDVRAGQRVDVRLRSEEFDTYLALVPPAGDPFYRDTLFNDDADGATDSALSVIAGVDGSWRAVVSSFSPEGAGEYDLEVFVGESGRTQNLAQSSLADSDSVSIKGLRYAVYTVTLDGNAQLLVEMAADFEPMIIAEGPGGARETGTADADGSIARLDITLPRAGRWRIIATQAGEGEAGRYALRVIETPLQGADAITGSLDEGDPTDLEGEHYDLHRIRGSADRPLVLTLMSSDFDAFLAARSESGEWFRDDDGGGDTSAKLELPPGAGTWQVFVTSFSGGETGRYRLTVRR
jgi:hypothetical protein